MVAAAPPQRLGGGFPSEVPGTLVVASAEDAVPDAQIAAPGRSVLTTIPGGEYDMESGSSLACAQVSGIVALLRSLMPSAEAPSLRRALRESMNPSTGSVNACQAARHLGVQGLRCS